MLWMLLISPLLSFALIVLFLQRRPALAAFLSIGSAIANGFLVLVGWDSASASTGTHSFRWLDLHSLTVSMTLSWDSLTRLMAGVVTWVGTLIHIYSLQYMRGDPRQARFFGYLSLFMFSMLGIVLSSNLIMMFIFWELVGLSSYLLIGFWHQRPSAADAGNKAFLVNKLGDFGFLLGILFVWLNWGTVDFTSLQNLKHQGWHLDVPIGVAMFLLFCGAMGKSAQIPLHIWLPDAMEGPTPVSALIHAATMVAAGVFMLCRILFLIELSPEVLALISWTGGVTTCLAALWAMAQDDIKRILAYSTLSQLGYMTMAVGLGSAGSAMFHLSTHACFKALLFLGAGSIILALHHEQNIWKMGGLFPRMPLTATTFFVGFLALAGVVWFSGASSKDEILALAYEKNLPLFIVGTLTAGLTTLYMGRLVFVVFLGRPRSPEAAHASENGPVITIPLLIFAIFSLGAFWNLKPVRQSFEWLGQSPLHSSQAVHALLILMPLLGMGLAWAVYSNAPEQDPLAVRLPRLYRLLASKFYFDEAYRFLIRSIQDRMANLFKLTDTFLIDGLCVRGTSLGIMVFGNVIRCFQTGHLQTYALFSGLLLALLIFWFVLS